MRKCKSAITTALEKPVHINHALAHWPHSARKVRSVSPYWLSTKLYSLEIVYRSCNMCSIVSCTPRKWHLLVYRLPGTLLALWTTTGVQSGAKGRETHANFTYYVRNNGFHPRSYTLSFLHFITVLNMSTLCHTWRGVQVGVWCVTPDVGERSVVTSHKVHWQLLVRTIYAEITYSCSHSTQSVAYRHDLVSVRP